MGIRYSLLSGFQLKFHKIKDLNLFLYAFFPFSLLQIMKLLFSPSYFINPQLSRLNYLLMIKAEFFAVVDDMSCDSVEHLMQIGRYNSVMDRLASQSMRFDHARRNGGN